MQRHVIQLDGWRIAVPWEHMYWGESFFVPSTNIKADRKAIVASANEAKCNIAIVRVKENGVQGLRVWFIEPVL